MTKSVAASPSQTLAHSVLVGRGERECPDVAITHLLASVAPYLATERSPSPPIPPHLELDPGEEDGVFEYEGRYERRMRHLHERRWGAYAWP